MGRRRSWPWLSDQSRPWLSVRHSLDVRGHRDAGRDWRAPVSGRNPGRARARRILEVIVLRRLMLLSSALLLIAVAACNAPVANPATPGASGAGATLTVGLGYIPSVQFAPFYGAQQQGYYADAGLQVTFQNEIDPNLVTLLGQGALDVGMADGTSVIPAVAQEIPVKYAATVYALFPNV